MARTTNGWCSTIDWAFRRARTNDRRASQACRDDVTTTASSNVQTYRLRTNLEIYWDWIGLAEPLEAVDFREHEVNLTKADLRSRGIVEMVQASASAPELPVYQRLIARGQYWRDLVGYHTRPGDIRELIAAVDDRYAILTAVMK